MKNIITAFIITIFFTPAVYPQNYSDEPDSTYLECSHGGFGLVYQNNGIYFGNSQNNNGIRFNFIDCGIENINGINITLWKPQPNPGSEINGIALGLMPSAGDMNGLSIGLGAVIAERSMNGLSLGILANVSKGEINGLNISGLASVGGKDISGINLGGLALVSKGI